MLYQAPEASTEVEAAKVPVDCCYAQGTDGREQEEPADVSELEIVPITRAKGISSASSADMATFKIVQFVQSVQADRLSNMLPEGS